MELNHTEPPLDQPYYGAPFGAALARFVKKGVTFTGRASLSEYWYSYLAMTGITLILLALSTATQFTNAQGIGFVVLIVLLLVALASIVPQFAVTVRRLHDAGLSGGMYFMSWIPFAGGIILLVMLARPSDARGARFDVVPAVATSALETRSSIDDVLPAVPLPLTGAAPAVPMPSVPMPASAPAGPLPAAPAVPLPQSVPAGAGFSIPASADPIQSVPGVAVPLLEQTAEELESTRLAPARTQAEWQIVWGDGRRLAVTSALRVGRDPNADPAFPGMVLVPIDDPAKSLSKTHAQLEASPGLLVVTDLHSTNGTRVRTADGAEIALAPDKGHPLTGDAEISFGDYIIRLHRQA